MIVCEEPQGRAALSNEIVQGDDLLVATGPCAKFAGGQVDNTAKPRGPFAAVAPQVETGSTGLALSPYPPAGRFVKLGKFLPVVVGFRADIGHQFVEVLMGFHDRNVFRVTLYFHGLATVAELRLHCPGGAFTFQSMCGLFHYLPQGHLRTGCPDFYLLPD